MRPVADKTEKPCEIHFKGCKCREKKFDRMEVQLSAAIDLLSDARLINIKCKCHYGHVCIKHKIEEVLKFIKGV